MSVSKSEQFFLNHLKKQEQKVFNTEEVRHFWGSSENTDNALSRLLQKHQIFRLCRGVYALPSFASDFQPNCYDQLNQIAIRLVPDAVFAYQTAMSIYDDSFFPLHQPTCHIQTSHRKRDTVILGVNFIFVQIKPDHLFDIYSKVLENHRPINITGLEKTIIDTANHPEYTEGIPALAHFIELFAPMIDGPHLQQAVWRMQNGAIAKRLGYIIDHFDIHFTGSEACLDHWQQERTRGIILLDPKAKTRGHIHTHWDVEDNVFECKDDSK